MTTRSSSAPEELAKRGLVAGLLKTIRPHQWVKNFFVLAPAVFAKNFFQRDPLIHALGAVAVFCLISGAVYTMNDVIDADADRVHPVKRFRPIASGQVPVGTAKIWLLVLLASAFIGAFVGFDLPLPPAGLASFLSTVPYSPR